MKAFLKSMKLVFNSFARKTKQSCKGIAKNAKELYSTRSKWCKQKFVHNILVQAINFVDACKRCSDTLVKRIAFLFRRILQKLKGKLFYFLFLVAALLAVGAIVIAQEFPKGFFERTILDVVSYIGKCIFQGASSIFNEIFSILLSLLSFGRKVVKECVQGYTDSFSYKKVNPIVLPPLRVAIDVGESSTFFFLLNPFNYDKYVSNLLLSFKQWSAVRIDLELSALQTKKFLTNQEQVESGILHTFLRRVFTEDLHVLPATQEQRVEGAKVYVCKWIFDQFEQGRQVINEMEREVEEIVTRIEFLIFVLAIVVTILFVYTFLQNLSWRIESLRKVSLEEFTNVSPVALKEEEHFSNPVVLKYNSIFSNPIVKKKKIKRWMAYLIIFILSGSSLLLLLSLFFSFNSYMHCIEHIKRETFQLEKQVLQNLHIATTLEPYNALIAQSVFYILHEFIIPLLQQQHTLDQDGVVQKDFFRFVFLLSMFSRIGVPLCQNIAMQFFEIARYQFHSLWTQIKAADASAQVVKWTIAKVLSLEKLFKMETQQNSSLPGDELTTPESSRDMALESTIDTLKFSIDMEAFTEFLSKFDSSFFCFLDPLF